jgi:hypothetical protein
MDAMKSGSELGLISRDQINTTTANDNNIAVNELRLAA